MIHLIKRISLILTFLIISTLSSFSQGCNDAGLCTFGDLGAIHSTEPKKSFTEISYIFGLGEKEALINTIQFDQSFTIFKDKGKVFVRLPFTYVYGNIGQTAGLGDVVFGMEMRLFKKNEASMSITAGGKIPSNNANLKNDDKGMPMAYQTSLGTYDLLMSANVDIQKWRIVLGYQKPFGSNGNTFLHEDWEDNDQAQEYFESYHLKRGDDAMLRLDRYFIVGKKNTLSAGLLGVYRIQEDQITKNNEQLSLDQSSGITLNASLVLSMPLKNSSTLRLLLAAPIITRKHRADGLTRTFVIGVTYALGSGRQEEISIP